MALKLLGTLALLLGLITAASAQTVKLAHGNIQHGTGTDGVVNISRQVTSLTSGGVDVVGLNEVSVGDVATYDTAFTSAGFTRALFDEHPKPGDGNAIYYRSSTITLLQTYTHDLVNGTNPTSGSSQFGFDGATDIRRSAVAAKFSRSGQQFYAVAVHFCQSACEDSASTNFASQRVNQINSLIGWINSTLTGGLSIVVMGDFNMPPNYPRGTEVSFTADSGTDVITATAHGWANGTPVVLRNSGGAVPGGLAAGDSLYAGATVYYVRDATANTLKLAASPGGAAINLTTNGTGSNFIVATQLGLFLLDGHSDLWQAGLTAGTATANWGDRDTDSIADMPLGFQSTRTHDSRRIDYITAKGSGWSLSAVDVPDTRATCSVALTVGGNFKQCPDVPSGNQIDNTEDQGVRPSDHNFVTATVTLIGGPTANAGPDRTILANEPLVLDGTASTGASDGLQADGRHSIRWALGYGGWTYEGGLAAPIVYPTPGTYTATITVCNAGGTCVSDSAQVTVSAVTEGTETIVADTGNAITNGTNLKNAITAAAASDNPVITVVAGATYDFDGTAFVFPNRTGSGYLTLRTSAHASLPDDTTRVSLADAANMATITPGDHTGNPAINSAEPAFTAPRGAGPGHHYRLLGIRFAKKFSTLDYSNARGFVDLGNGTGTFTSIANLPHHFIFDRCIVDGGNTTAATTRGFALAASDVSVVNSYIYRVQGVGFEVQAVWIGMGERFAIINNFLQATTENMMTGGALVNLVLEENTAQATGNDSTHIKLAASASAVADFYVNKGIFINAGTGASQGRIITAYDSTTKIATVEPAWTTVPDDTSAYRIGEHVPSDIVVRRNYLKKDRGWLATDPSYYGVNMAVKNLFELKQARRASIEGNRLEDHWQEDQNWAITLTVRGESGTQPWATLAFIDFSHNQMINIGNGFQVMVSDSSAPSLGSVQLLARHNVLSGFQEGGFENFATMQDSGTAGAQSTIGDRVQFVRNSSDPEDVGGGKGRMFMFETSSRFRNLVVYGNIGEGYITGNGNTGINALVQATGGGSGSYSVTKNGFYTTTGTNPPDNTTVARLSDVKYTDIVNHNLALLGDSPFLTTGPAGGRAGADIGAVDSLTSGAVTGIWDDDPPPPPSGNGGGKQRGKATKRGKVANQ